MTKNKDFVENKNVNDNTGNVAQEPPTLSIQDLSLVLQIIDLSFSRGAFNGVEASDVGNVYKKISNFVNFTVESQNANEENNQKE